MITTRLRRRSVSGCRALAGVLRKRPRLARADASAHYEFWVGETCFGIWERDTFGKRRHGPSILRNVPLPFPLPTAFASATLRRYALRSDARIAA
jgi:hypothetical protein